MIDTTDKDILNKPLIEGVASYDDIDVDYKKEVPDGDYLLTLVKIYPWKTITKDTRAIVRDDNGKVVKDTNGKAVQEEVKNLTWHMANAVFAVEEGPYEGAAVFANLSTHPNGIGQLKSFMYCAGLFSTPAGEIKDHLGVDVGAAVRNKTRTYTDSDTGIEKTITEPTVYFFKKTEDVASDYPEL